MHKKPHSPSTHYFKWSSSLWASVFPHPSSHLSPNTPSISTCLLFRLSGTFLPYSHYLHGILQGSSLSSPILHCHPFPSDLHFYRTSVTAWYIYVCACSEDWIQVLVREVLTELTPQLPFVLFCLFTVCLFTLHKKIILCFAQNSAWYTVSPQEVFVEEINCSLHKPFSLKRLDEFCFVSDPNYFFLQLKKLKYNYIFRLHPTPSKILCLLSLKFIVSF